MKFDYKPLLHKTIDFILKFRYILVGFLVVLVLIIAVFRINQHSNVNQNQERYDEQLLTIKRIDFDQDVVQQILDLNDLNIDIDSIFPDNRNNPFN